MAVAVIVKGDVEESIKFLTKLQRKHVPQAVSSALNKTMVSVKALSSREIRNHIRLSAQVVKKQLWVKKASRVKWFTRLTAKARDVPLMQFKPKETTVGLKNKFSRFGAPLKSVRVRVSPKRPSRIIRRGFFAYGKSIVAQRKEGTVRGPIKALFGPAIDKRFDNPITRRVMRGRTKEQFPKNFKNQIGRILRRRT